MHPVEWALSYPDDPVAKAILAKIPTDKLEKWKAAIAKHQAEHAAVGAELSKLLGIG